MYSGKWNFQLQSYSCQIPCRSLCNLLATRGRASEGDFVNIRAPGEPRPESIVAAEDLKNPWGEELLGQLDYLETAVRRER